MNSEPTRIRLTYAKLGNLRFIGHLDLQRLFERALRRTGLPLRYTQGFSPHLRLNLASALPLGFIGEAEQMDFWLDCEVPLEEVEKHLKNALPFELVVQKLQVIGNHQPSLQASLLSSDFEVLLPEEVDTVVLQTKIDSLLAQESLPVQRRKKTVDLKSLLISTRLVKKEHQSILEVIMKSTPLENGRPDELLEMLGIDAADCQVVRTKLTYPEE